MPDDPITGAPIPPPPPPESPFDESKKQPRTNRQYKPMEMGRVVRVYKLSSTEMLGLSILNPAGAAMIGYGVNVACAWAQMPDTDKSKPLVGFAALGSLIVGASLIVFTWGFFGIVRWQSR